jgi:ABC-type sugar transport system substrate-binding protein
VANCIIWQKPDGNWAMVNGAHRPERKNTGWLLRDQAIDSGAIKMVSDTPHENKSEQCMKAAENFLANNDEIDVVLALNDGTAAVW